MKHMKLLLGASFGVFACIGWANATVVSYNVSFTATGFSSLDSTSPPVNPVVGDFTITMDTAQTYTDSTVGISLISLNIPLDSALSFDYNPSTPTLYVGGLFDGASTIPITPASSNDFYLQITNFNNLPTAAFLQLGYVETSHPNGFWYTQASNPTGSATITPTPEPSSIASLVAGLGVVGLIRRRRLV